MGLLDGPTFTTATNTSTASKPITIEELNAMVAQLDKFKTPPPNKKRCENCKEPMEHDGHPIYAAMPRNPMMPASMIPPMGPPACYVCGRCYYLIRQWARSLPE